jgi:hypothetical protein
MHGQPHRGLCRVGPVDAVAGVGWEVEEIAGAEEARGGFALDEEAGGADEEENPFRAVLVVPEAGRAALAVRDDALDREVRAAQQLGEALLREIGRQVG